MPLRIGFAGANPERGWARDAHLGAVRLVPGVTVHAVSARTQAIADAAMAMFDAEIAYSDSLVLARDPQVDVVTVTVKVPEHRAIVLAALDAGKHVYCEWPLGRDLAETEELAAAARTAGTHCMIGTQGSVAPAVRHAAALVAEGAIGRPRSLRVVSATQGWGEQAPPHYAYLQDKRNGATLSTIAGGHTLAMIETIVGPYVELSAINSILVPEVGIVGTGETVTRTSPDHILVIGRHASGCVSSLEVLGGAATPLRFELAGTRSVRATVSRGAATPLRFELAGSAGSLEIGGGQPGGFQVGDLTVETRPPSPAAPPRAIELAEGASINVGELWSAFAADIRHDTRTVPDFDDAVRLARLLDAIDTASDEGRRVDIDR